MFWSHPRKQGVKLPALVQTEKEVKVTFMPLGKEVRMKKER